MSTAKQLIDELIHLGAADDRRDVDVVVETPDGQLLDLQALSFDEDEEAFVVTATAR